MCERLVGRGLLCNFATDAAEIRSAVGKHRPLFMPICQPSASDKDAEISTDKLGSFHMLRTCLTHNDVQRERWNLTPPLKSLSWRGKQELSLQKS